jgi:hypothetical protein
MKRWLATMVILGGWAGLGAHAALAQPGYIPPSTGPGPSGLPPGLSLVPNNPYIQYFGLAQPQYNNARALQQLQAQINQTGYLPLGMTGSALQPNMIMTGHAVSFQNLSHYYPANGNSYPGSSGSAYGGYGGVGGPGGIMGYPNVNTPLAQGYAQFVR